MKQLLFFLFFVCVFSLFLVTWLVADEARKPVVAVIVCEENDEHLYNANENLPLLIEELGKENNWEIVILKSLKSVNFPSLEILDKVDVVVIYVRRIALPQEQMQRLKKYVKESGKGLVAIRTACHGFAPREISNGCEDWKEFDHEVLGGNYTGHGNNEIGSEIWNVTQEENSKILKEVKPKVWHSDSSVYFNMPIAQDATIYQYAASSEKGKQPLTWTRMYGNTRVAYTALGHKNDFKLPVYKTLIRNLIQWAAN